MGAEAGGRAVWHDEVMSRLRYLTAGESHGPALVAILEGLPAGLPISTKQIADELTRRRHGYGRGPRMKVEEDRLRILSGVRGGVTLGSPLAVLIENSEYESKWARVMPVEGAPGGRPLTRPRPGHADLPGMLKYGFTDARDVLERASARETAARVAIGAVAKTLLGRAGVTVISHVTRIGDASVGSDAPRPGPGDLEAIDAAGAEGDSLGGVVEVLAFGVPPGLGSYVHWDRKIDGRLAGALMAIPAIKGVALGDGFELAERRGSLVHDEILPGLERASDRAGGTEGGMTIGGTLRLSVAMKPLSTLKRRLRTVDMSSGEAAEAFQERTDVCAVPAAGVVCEAVTALVLADALLEQFPADTLEDLEAALARHRDKMERRARP